MILQVATLIVGCISLHYSLNRISLLWNHLEKVGKGKAPIRSPLCARSTTSVMCSAVSRVGRLSCRRLIQILHTKKLGLFFSSSFFSTREQLSDRTWHKRFFNKGGPFNKTRWVAAATKLEKQVSLLACRWCRSASPDWIKEFQN